MSAKESFIRDVNDGMSVTAAAGLHGIGRSCAYKWVARYAEFGEEGLEERSRAPMNRPNQTGLAIVRELLALKEKHPDLGPAKFAQMLANAHGEHVLAPSTAGEILARHGLVRRRRRRERNPGKISHAPFDVGNAGHSMTADYKGQFRLKNGSLCYPLTIADPISRCVLAIDALPSTSMELAKVGFERVFRKFGVPRQLITDNGTPFCSTRSLGGLTGLSRRWIELGIVPIRIQPGQPQQNGVHERMHRTLKQWIQRHPTSNLRDQQRSFDAFRHEFNEVRPHQSLGQQLPATVLEPYRPFPSRLHRFEYDARMTVRSVRSNGEIKWNGELIFTSEVLINAKIGLLEVDEALWEIYFHNVRLGWLDGLTQTVKNEKPQRQKTKGASREKTKTQN
jgi:transposase InsO family protein